jgi:hypothetical protein
LGTAFTKVYSSLLTEEVADQVPLIMVNLLPLVKLKPYLSVFDFHTVLLILAGHFDPSSSSSIGQPARDKLITDPMAIIPKSLNEFFIDSSFP